MTDVMYPTATRETAQKRRDLAPDTQAAFDAFSRQVFAEGALSAKMKQIVAVAVAHATQGSVASFAGRGDRSHAGTWQDGDWRHFGRI